LLVIEDYSPTDFKSTRDVTDWDEQQVSDSKALGKSFLFLSNLVASFHTVGIDVIITTRFERVARALHFIVKGGSKCKIARSLLDPTIKDYTVTTKDYAGTSWPDRIFSKTSSRWQVLAWSTNNTPLAVLISEPAAIRDAPATIQATSSSAAPSMLQSSQSDDVSESSEEEVAGDSFCDALGICV
jgi:hypothetical protein